MAHHTLASRLTAKRDLLAEAARQFAFGSATIDDLMEAAVEFTSALEEKAIEHLRGVRT
jgi:hypothetical protein